MALAVGRASIVGFSLIIGVSVRRSSLGRDKPGYDVAGQGIANPAATIEAVLRLSKAKVAALA